MIAWGELTFHVWLRPQYWSVASGVLAWLVVDIWLIVDFWRVTDQVA